MPQIIITVQPTPTTTIANPVVVPNPPEGVEMGEDMQEEGNRGYEDVEDMGEDMGEEELPGIRGCRTTNHL